MLTDVQTLHQILNTFSMGNTFIINKIIRVGLLRYICIILKEDRNAIPIWMEYGSNNVTNSVVKLKSYSIFKEDLGI